MNELGGSVRLDPTAAPRSLWQAMKRGTFGRCPNCGEGKLFKSYLKVADTCPACGEEMFHQRADDAPPYVTIFIVGHIVVGGLLIVEDMWPNVSFASQAIGWSLVTIVLSLVILPMAKGALIGLQWALRMHGFDKHTQNPAPASAALSPSLLGTPHTAH